MSTRLLRFHFKEGVSLPPLTGSYLPTKQPAQILRLDEPREHFITPRARNPKNQCLKLPQMLIPNGEVNAETIPSVRVPVTKVLFQTSSEIGCQADIVKTVPLVQGINAVPPSHVFTNDVRELLECSPRDALKMLAYELCRSSPHRAPSHADMKKKKES